MSKYTTELRYICESLAGLEESVGYNDIADVIKASREKIFSFDYPIFDESYKPLLETKILMHFYTREIGSETYGLWKLRLNSKMNEIMPYYNKLYKSELIEFNPLYDVDITVDHNRTNNDTRNGLHDNSTSGTGTGTNTDSSERAGWNLFQDTPQNGLQNVQNMEYLSSATKDTDESNSTSQYSSSTTGRDTGSYSDTYRGIEDYLEHISGTHGGISFSKKIKDFRENFLNIDMMVIRDLNDLFMLLW